MVVSLDVANDLLSSELSSSDEIITKALNILFDNYKEYMDLISYWSLDGEPIIEDCLALTPEIRKLKKNRIVQMYISFHLAIKKLYRDHRQKIGQ